MEKRGSGRERDKIDEIVRLLASETLAIFNDTSLDEAPSINAVEKRFRDVLSSETGKSERNRLLSVLDALRSGSMTKVDPRAVMLAKRIVPALPSRDVWLVTPTESGGVVFETAIASIEVKVSPKGRE